MQTYWANPVAQCADESEFTARSDMEQVLPKEAVHSRKERIARLVDWNTTLLLDCLRQVVARRKEILKKDSLLQMEKQVLQTIKAGQNEMVLDEVVDIISLPRVEPGPKMASKAADVVLPEKVEKQLKRYITTIAATYRDNPFHNFEHASHVCLSVHKLLSRIVAPDRIRFDTDDVTKSQTRSTLSSSFHDPTHGITADPLTQLGIVLSALIHDVDHAGVSNARLIVENPGLGKAYKAKSVAEQNSVGTCPDVLLCLSVCLKWQNLSKMLSSSIPISRYCLESAYGRSVC